MLRQVALMLMMVPTAAFAQSGGNSEWSVAARSAAAPAADIMTNEDVIDMIVTGIPEQLILGKIRTSEPQFDTTTQGIIDLSTAGVPTQIIQMMVTRSSAETTRAGRATRGAGIAAQKITELSVDSPDPMIPHVPGIYLINPAGAAGFMRMVQPVEAELEGGGNFLLSVASAGMMGGGSGRAEIKGSNALIRTTNRSPVFYVYFDESVPNDLRSHAPTIWGAGGGATIATPQDLQLVEMKVKKGYREARIGRKIREKDEILFSTEMLKPGVYRLTVRSRLEPGEYGFVQSMRGNDNSGRGSARVFDFEVQ